jgi:hypothetical protein
MAGNGIFCLEGNWDEGLEQRASVRHLLELVRAQNQIKTIHKNATTREEFGALIKEWLKAKYRDYPVLYLAFHGEPGAIEIGREFVPIRDLHELFDARARGRFIHFGSCQTLGTSRRNLQHFFKHSHAAAISGFTSKVDWLEGCALEIMLFHELARRKIDSGSLEVTRRMLHRRAGSLSRHLKFRFFRNRDLLR